MNKWKIVRQLILILLMTCLPRPSESQDKVRLFVFAGHSGESRDIHTGKLFVMQPGGKWTEFSKGKKEGIIIRDNNSGPDGTIRTFAEGISQYDPGSVIAVVRTGNMLPTEKDCQEKSQTLAIIRESIRLLNQAGHGHDAELSALFWGIPGLPDGPYTPEEVLQHPYFQQIDGLRKALAKPELPVIVLYPSGFDDYKDSRDPVRRFFRHFRHVRCLETEARGSSSLGQELASRYYTFSMAPTPPLGWNSFDSYGVYLHHDAALANLEAFARKLKPAGYTYFVIDAGWFGEFKLVDGTLYSRERHASILNFDENGLLQPSHTYFPHGIQTLIDRCHALGLKFGLHLMRGIPREAVRLNLPVKGTAYRAADIADTTSICWWNDQNYGVDVTRPGGQEFYNSLINQMADWGVDFIKYDDLVPYPDEVKAVAKAIAQSGRPMVLSLSPGGKVLDEAIGFYRKGNMLRVTRDIWDDDTGLEECFAAWRKWQGSEEPGFWIDMDMIPFGQLQLMSPRPEGIGETESHESVLERKKRGELSHIELTAGKGWTRWSQLTKDQMYSFITLRALSASPLMMGGDLPGLDDFSLELITHPQVIACNQNGVMGELVWDANGIEIWRTFEKESQNAWVGIFNRSSEAHKMDLKKADIGISNPQAFSRTSIWENKVLEEGPLHIAPGGVVFIRYQKLEK